MEKIYMDTMAYIKVKRKRLMALYKYTFLAVDLDE